MRIEYAQHVGAFFRQIGGRGIKCIALNFNSISRRSRRQLCHLQQRHQHRSLCVRILHQPDESIFQGNAPPDDGAVFYIDGATVYYYYGTSGCGSTFGGAPTVMLGAPAPQVGSGSIGVQSGNFGFTLTGVTHQTVMVEASTNLVNWQPVWTNRLSGASTNFTDAQWTNFPNRFYRVSTP